MCSVILPELYVLMYLFLCSAFKAEKRTGRGRAREGEGAGGRSSSGGSRPERLPAATGGAEAQPPPVDAHHARRYNDMAPKWVLHRWRNGTKGLLSSLLICLHYTCTLYEYAYACRRMATKWSNTLVTPIGLYEFSAMAFGSKVSPIQHSCIWIVFENLFNFRLGFIEEETYAFRQLYYHLSHLLFLP